jgi:DNA-binding transcriptional LysR family regulator
MEFRQVLHFVRVAEEESFTRAARRTNIVQSALSTSIRLLEEELGARLFTRHTRHVKLTAAGRVFLDKAYSALQALSQGKELVAEVAALRRGKLALGTVQSLPSFLDLPALLERFHNQYPEIEVRLCQGSVLSLVEKIRSVQIELAILPIEEAPPDLATRVVACDSMVLACAKDHRLAGAGRLSLEQLSEEAFVDFEMAHGTRKIVDGAFANARLERRIAFEVGDLDTLLELVGRGLGIALVPKAIAEAKGKGLAQVELETELCWELVVAYIGSAAGEDTLDGAPAAFLKLLVEQVEEEDRP